MKRIVMSMAAVALAGGMMAQSNQISLGADLAMPMGDFADAYSLGIGPTAGFELPVGDNLGVTVQLSYMFLTPNEDIKDFVESASMMPVQAGLKYYFMEQQSGFYGHLQLGIHSSSYKSKEYTIPGVPGFTPDIVVPSETESSSNFSWAIGAGYQLEKLDIGIRYNSISPDSDVEGAEASSYLGLRVAYLINLGD